MTYLPHLEKRDGTALVLSGGATKAFYFHMGVLKVLQEEPITSVVGTSAGGIVGAMIASGASVDTLESSLYQKEVYVPKFDVWIDNLTSNRLFKPKLSQLTKQSLYTGWTSLRFLASLPILFNRDIVAEILERLIKSQEHVTGFFDAVALEDLFKAMLPTNSFANAEIDLYVTGTALDSQIRAVFNNRYDFETDDDAFMTDVPIHRAVRASSAIPGMFEPVLIKGDYYVDGEIKRTLSADIGVRLANRVIMSHTYQPLYLNGSATVRNMGWLNILRQSVITVLHERINRWREYFEEQETDTEIIWIHPEPDDVEFFQAPEFSFRPDVQQKLIKTGEIAAKKVMDKIVPT